jgi:hypothetical protein
VAAVREPRPSEVAIADTLDGNAAVGPNFLVAHIRIVKNRGYLVVENSQTGEDSLFVCPYASLPEWSPDGRYLSCNLWTPETRMGKLVVFEVASWKKVANANLASTGSAEWSPDSKRIVSDGVSYHGGKMILYCVSIPGGEVSVIDSTTAMNDIEFSWNRDSRWITYSRPTRLTPIGETRESDLCIANALTGESWCLIKARDHNESNPYWIDDHSIQVDRVWWTAGEGEADWTSRERRVVVILKPVR